jgi:hypothetical protein
MKAQMSEKSYSGGSTRSPARSRLVIAQLTGIGSSVTRLQATITSSALSGPSGFVNPANED